MNGGDLFRRRLVIGVFAAVAALAIWWLARRQGLVDAGPACESGRTVERAADGTVTKVTRKTCATPR